MKSCPTCQREYADSSKFCEDDGTALQTKSTAPKADSGISIGEKAIVTGEVVGRKEEHQYHGTTNVTHITQQLDPRSNLKICCVCGIQKEASAGFFLCPECGKDVCGSHYDEPARRCQNCLEQLASDTERQYSEAVNRCLDVDIVFDAEKREQLDILRRKLGIKPVMAGSIEKTMREKRVLSSWGPDDAEILKRAIQANKDGDTDYALEHLNHLRKANRNRPEVWEAWLEVMQTQSDEAALQAAQECPIDLPLKIQMLIEIHGRLGHFPEAREFLRYAQAAKSADYIASRPRFQALKALLDLWMWQEKKSTTWLKDAERTLAEQANSQDGFIDVVHAYVEYYKGDDSLLWSVGNKFSKDLAVLSLFSRITKDMVPQDQVQAVAWYRRAAERGEAKAQTNLAFCYYNGNGIQQNHILAFNWWEKAAEQGDKIAQCNMGICYLLGDGVLQDPTQAVGWFRKAAEQGNAIAQDYLGTHYWHGDGVLQDLTKAFYWHKKSAEQGNAKAQFNLGLHYANGSGVPQDWTQAVYWYTRAAEQGDANAQNSLANIYDQGTGVSQDKTQSIVWLTKAAEQGFVAAQFNLGLHYANGSGVPQDWTQAVYWYTKAAEQGDPIAQGNLGLNYVKGVGVVQDFDKAIYWLTKASEQGNIDAQMDIANCYTNGTGVPRDETKAVYWYNKAAEQGNAIAQYYLGMHYWDGDGVLQDLAKAFYWYTKSAEQENVEAQYNLGICYQQGKGVTQDSGKAFYWWCKSAKQGLSIAQFNLSLCYYHGDGVPKDMIQFFHWTQKSAEQGHADAQFNLGECYNVGLGIAIDINQAVIWFNKAAIQGHKQAQEKISQLAINLPKPISSKNQIHSDNIILPHLHTPEQNNNNDSNLYLKQISIAGVTLDLHWVNSGEILMIDHDTLLSAILRVIPEDLGTWQSKPVICTLSNQTIEMRLYSGYYTGLGENLTNEIRKKISNFCCSLKPWIPIDSICYIRTGSHLKQCSANHILMLMCRNFH